MSFTYDSVLGCILGGALGDVLGGIPERRNLSFSDDTQLTLATCEAIVEEGKVTAASIAAHMLRWFTKGRISGIGSSTLKAMRDLEAGAHWALSGARGERAAGNGAAMRAAPLAFLLDPGIDGHRVVIRDVARITHHHDEAYAGALSVVWAVRQSASTGRVPRHEELAGRLPDSRTRDQHLRYVEEARGLGLTEVAMRFGASGYTPETVAMALELALRIEAGDFSSVMGELHSIHGDTDTIGAIGGNIAGAALGAQRLPSNTLDEVPRSDAVVAIAEGFARFVSDDVPPLRG
jgi:ADP-ribosylglycohydrolase